MKLQNISSEKQALCHFQGFIVIYKSCMLPIGLLTHANMQDDITSHQ